MRNNGAFCRIIIKEDNHGHKSSSNIVEDSDSIETLNQLLYDARDYIIGRMGIPYREKGISIISIAIDASQDIISALSGKIGRLKGVSTKTAYSNVITHAEEKHD